MRLLIAPLLLLLLSSSAAAPFPPSGVDLSPQLTGPPSTDHWAEFLRTAAASVTGAFVGAGAAFLANLKLQKRAHRLEQIAAGNYAMATLTRQYNGFLNAQRGIRQELARCKKEAPQLPRWFAFRPIIHFLPTTLDFDFHSLTFLFEKGDVEFFYRLHSAESLQRDLMGHMARLNEISFEKQERFEKAGFVEDNMNVTAKQVHDAVGPRLIVDLDAIIEQLEMHADKDGPEYLRAGDELYSALSKHFGPGQRVLRLVGRAPMLPPDRQ